MVYNSRTNKETPMITDEQILELAEKHFSFIATDWFADDSEGLLKFARAIYEEGYDKGHDGGWEDRGIAESSTYPSGLVGDP
jgi:hypothetical protein